MLITVVTPVYNLESSLALTLQCLENQTLPRDQFECVFVDDASTDGSLDVLRRLPPDFPAQIVVNQRNEGRSISRNAGCRAAKGEIIVFLDGDMLTSPDLLKNYAAAFSEGNYDVISGGRYALRVKNTPSPRGMAEQIAAYAGCNPVELFSSAEVSARFARIQENAVLGTYVSPVHERLERELRQTCRLYPESLVNAYSFITSNVAVRRSVFEETGGFDPSLRRHVDTELGIRLWEAGAKFGFRENAQAYHLYDASQTDRRVDVLERIGFLYRHPYRTVILMNLWSWYCSSPLSSPPPALSSLVNLAGNLGRECDLKEEYFKVFKTPIATHCDLAFEQVANYYEHLSAVPHDEICEYLRDAEERGLVTERRGGVVYFDLHCTTNWLRTKSRYKQYERLRNNYARNQIRGQHPEADENRQIFRYAGQYRVSIPASVLPPGVGTVIELPLPIPHKNQLGVRVTQIHGKVSNYDSDGRSILCFELPIKAPSIVEVGYDFECIVSEARSPLLDSIAVDAEGVDSCLQHQIPGPYRSKAQQIIERSAALKAETPYDSANRIYQWMLDHFISKENPYPSYVMFETGWGTCFQRSWLFVNLCRMAGVPARLQCGSLLLAGRVGADPQILETRTTGPSPFVHTWSEFFDPSRGWMPVEFLGWAFGGRSATSRNVSSEMRAQMETDTLFFDKYYFGSLDPYRVYSDRRAADAVSYPAIRQGNRLMPIQHAILETRHTLKCLAESVGNLTEGHQLTQNEVAK